MKIGAIDLDRRPLLIAEIGNNHEGNADVAFKLAEAAMDAGADAVKVQIIDPVRLVNRSEEQRIAQLTRYRLPREVFLEIGSRIRAKGGLFMASVFDCNSLAQWAPELDAIKIASGDLDFDPLLQVAARSGKPVVLSTGMSTLDEIARAADIVAKELPKGVAIADRLAVLHCVSLYPTPLEQTNLAAMATLRDSLGVTIGYSDHTLGIASALVSLGLGARIVEKHFTLDKNYSAFRDHALSAEPAEFAELAKAFKAHAQMVGSGLRDGDLPDAATRAAARRGIVTTREIAAGETLSATDLDYVRPAKGFSPSVAGDVIGRRARVALRAHHVITAEDLA